MSDGIRLDHLRLRGLDECTLEDVKSVLDGLRPAIYMSADLYDKYISIMEDQGRTPVHRTRFGRMLAEYGLMRRRKNNAAAWLIQ